MGGTCKRDLNSFIILEPLLPALISMCHFCNFENRPIEDVITLSEKLSMNKQILMHTPNQQSKGVLTRFPNQRI